MEERLQLADIPLFSYIALEYRVDIPYLMTYEAPQKLHMTFLPIYFFAFISPAFLNRIRLLRSETMKSSNQALNSRGVFYFQWTYSVSDSVPASRMSTYRSSIVYELGLELCEWGSLCYINCQMHSVYAII